MVPVLILALDDDARRWIEGSKTLEPGRASIMKARTESATDMLGRECAGTRVRSSLDARAELFTHAGVIMEVPGELAQRTWDIITFPKNVF